MMSCDRLKDLLSLYIDDKLSAEQRRQVDEHLAKCPDCAAELAMLRQAVELAGSLDELELPEGFHVAVQARLAEAAASVNAAPLTAEAVSGELPGSRPVPIAQGLLIRTRTALRRPLWRGALATAAAVVLLFAVVSNALPGWNGNVWQLLSYRDTQLREPGALGSGSGTDTDINTGTKTPTIGEGTDAAGKGGGTAVVEGDRQLIGILNDTSVVVGNMVIRTGTLTVEVERFTDAERRVSTIVETAGGYIEQSSASLDGTVKSGWFRVRVPQNEFTAVIAKFEELGTVKQKEMGSEDVSAAIVDMEARIANLRRQELRLGELLSQAKTLDEILRVENELNRIRYQIESYEGQLKYLQNRVALATIALSLKEPGDPGDPPVPGADIWRQIWKAFVNTWRGIGRFAVGLVVFVASVAPVALLIGAAWLVFARYRGRRPASRN